MNNQYAIILAGGYGERFWPLSTKEKPKQFIDLIGDSPLITQSYNRIQPLIPHENIIIVTNSNLVEKVKEVIPNIPDENIIGEPMARNTAAAIVCAGAIIKNRDPDAIFVVLTADHIIKKEDLFRNTIAESMNLAFSKDVLITVGVNPTYPSTGFGYIQIDKIYSEINGIKFYTTKRFVEKPDRQTAIKYIDNKLFYWNSGMLICSISSFEKALTKYGLNYYNLFNNLDSYIKDNELKRGISELYPNVENLSIDYAILEKAENVVMAHENFIWDDVGTWTALDNHFQKNKDKNIFIGNVESLLSKNNIIYSPDRLTAVIGVKDLIIVQANDVTLVCHKSESENIKALVKHINQKNTSSRLV